MFHGVSIGICWSLPLIPPLCTRLRVVDELSPAGAVEESQALGQRRPSEHPSAPGGVTVPWRSGPRVAGGWLQVCGRPPGPPLRPARCAPPRLSAQEGDKGSVPRLRKGRSYSRSCGSPSNTSTLAAASGSPGRGQALSSLPHSCSDRIAFFCFTYFCDLMFQLNPHSDQSGV